MFKSDAYLPIAFVGYRIAHGIVCTVRYRIFRSGWLVGRGIEVINRGPPEKWCVLPLMPYHVRVGVSKIGGSSMKERRRICFLHPSTVPGMPKFVGSGLKNGDAFPLPPHSYGQQAYRIASRLTH